MVSIVMLPTLAMRWTQVLGSLGLWRMATSDASGAEDAVRMMCGNASGDHGLALIFSAGDQLGAWATDTQCEVCFMHLGTPIPLAEWSDFVLRV